MSPQKMAYGRVRKATTVFAAVGLMFGTAIGLLGPASAHENGTGLQADKASGAPDVASGGLYVVFESDATNLVAEDTNAARDIFLHDQTIGETVRVSVSSSGEQANGYSFNGGISGDGSVVAFDSNASNLVSGDTNNQKDTFIHNMNTGTTERVSVSSSEGQGTGQAAFVSVSDDGRFVVFTTTSALSSSDSGTLNDIYVRDEVMGTTELISVNTSGQSGNSSSNNFADISSDGRYVAFSSGASDLVSGDTNGHADVFLRDRAAATTTLVSVSSSGSQGDGRSGDTLYRDIALSDNGRYVAFGSRASNLVTGDSNFVHDVSPRRHVIGDNARVDQNWRKRRQRRLVQPLAVIKWRMDFVCVQRF